MKKYLLRTTTTMKPYNNKNWWIDGNVVTEKQVAANSVAEALELYAKQVWDRHGISISQTALLRDKSEMFRDTASGMPVQVGYVLTGKTDFQRCDGTWSTQYVDLWVEILTVVETEF